MIAKLIILTFVLIGGSVGYNFLPDLFLMTNVVPGFVTHPIFGMILGAGLGFILSFLAVKPIERWIKKVEDVLSEQNVAYLIFGSIGAVFGLILAWLISIPFVGLSIPVLSDVIPLLLAVILAYVGFHVASTRREEIRRLFQTRSTKEEENQLLERREGEAFRRNKILDTSAIIDGRILEVVKSGFMEGVLVVSHYVLQELQYIADSSDSLKRVRGRRGLDILNALQKEEEITVQMDDSTISDTDEVDMKLVHLAKQKDGMVVTNDFNLNKVAEFQNVRVLNINELANAVKPVVIPGEIMKVLIVKKGTERSQGVAYMDDGTMVVVEDGKHHINETIDVVVTSSLQTNAGRMIFSKIASEQEVLDDVADANGK